VVGTYATAGFLGMGAHVAVLDTDMDALQRIQDRFPTVTTMVSNPRSISRSCTYADVVVGAVLVPWERAPIVVTLDMIKSMKPRALIMDISIDQGGCVETSRPTTHEHPTFIKEGIVHYCVPNIPGVVARTATHALTNAAMPYILQIVDKNVEKAVAENPELACAVTTRAGELVNLSRLTPKDLHG